MSAAAITAEKRHVLLDLLDAGIVMLHLDPRNGAVVVPEHLKSEPTLRLQLAWGFKLPALDIREDHLHAVLSFNKTNFACSIPWDVIYAMTLPAENHEGVMWEQSIPADLPSDLAPSTAPMRRHLRLVKPEDSQ